MIRLRFLKSMVGARRVYEVDGEYDWPDVAEAVRLIGAGTAEAVKMPAKVETADAPDVSETPRRGPGRPPKQR